MTGGGCLFTVKIFFHLSSSRSPYVKAPQNKVFLASNISCYVLKNVVVSSVPINENDLCNIVFDKACTHIHDPIIQSVRAYGYCAGIISEILGIAKGNNRYTICTGAFADLSRYLFGHKIVTGWSMRTLHFHRSERNNYYGIIFEYFRNFFPSHVLELILFVSHFFLLSIILKI